MCCRCGACLPGMCVLHSCVTYSHETIRGQYVLQVSGLFARDVCIVFVCSMFT